MRNYLLKVPDHQWNASSPAKSSFQNLKIQYLGQQDLYFQINIEL
jgi:hypothetical protein